jgi:hypothetical protein
MVIHSENATHRANLFAAEAVRQAAAVPGASQATLKAAEIAFARTCLASAKANGCARHRSSWTCFVSSELGACDGENPARPIPIRPNGQGCNAGPGIVRQRRCRNRHCDARGRRCECDDLHFRVRGHRVGCDSGLAGHGDGHGHSWRHSLVHVHGGGGRPGRQQSIDRRVQSAAAGQRAQHGHCRVVPITWRRQHQQHSRCSRLPGSVLILDRQLERWRDSSRRVCGESAVHRKRRSATKCGGSRRASNPDIA